MAFGPSAHGYDGIKRWWNVSSIDDYIAKLSKNEKPVSGTETLNLSQRYNEQIILGLRTNRGIQKDFLQGFELGVNLELSLEKWENYLDISSDAIRMKPGHFHLADEIASDLMI